MVKKKRLIKGKDFDGWSIKSSRGFSNHFWDTKSKVIKYIIWVSGCRYRNHEMALKKILFCDESKIVRVKFVEIL